MILRRVCHASLSVAVSFSFLLQSTLASAQSVISADPAAAQRPNVGAASNGVPLIDLVAPNAAGVSHNKFTDFNVGRAGVVLNNSTVDGVSQLGGVVLANPNMAGRRAATLILNEVTSANRSRLEGFTEIFGQKADYVLANPNGITCDGCGFINTPRATLTTGVPQLDGNGGLASLAVRQGDVAITGTGLNASGIDALDIISRSVSLGGTVNAGSLTLVTGRNDVNYASRAATAVAGSTADAPLFAIDSSALGGMYANRIAMVATERGVGVNMQGEMAANAGELNITADGRLALRVASATGAMALRSVSDGLTVGQSAASGGALSVNAGTDVAATGARLSAGSDLAVTAVGAVTARNAELSAANGIAVQAGSLDLSDGKAVATAGSLTARADAAMTAERAQIGAGRSLALTAGSVSMASAVLAAGQGGATAAPPSAPPVLSPPTAPPCRPATEPPWPPVRASTQALPPFDRLATWRCREARSMWRAVRPWPVSRATEPCPNRASCRSPRQARSSMARTASWRLAVMWRLPQAPPMVAASPRVSRRRVTCR